MMLYLNCSRIMLQCEETCYFEPDIPQIPMRKGTYYTFKFTFMPSDENDEWFTEMIDWPVPLCTDPDDAVHMIDNHFCRGSCLWIRFWNLYLEGRDLSIILDKDEDPCSGYDFDCPRPECHEPDIDMYRVGGPYFSPLSGTEEELYPYRHPRPAFPAILTNIEKTVFTTLNGNGNRRKKRRRRS